MIIPQDNIYFCHVYIYIYIYIYIDLNTGNTLLQMFVKIVFVYMYYNNSPVDMSSQTFYKIQSFKNVSPIVLIEILTIVLKERRSERGYNPGTPSNFPYHSNVVPIDDTPT